MDFGIFNTMQQRHRSKSATEVLRDGVEQTKVAEELGFARVWYVEHHFSNYSICPSPLLMAAHMAGQTKTIRLGTAVVVAPLYQPPRLLAEIAMVDTLSDGRLDVGVGAGYQDYEFSRFGITLDNRCEKTVEVIRASAQGPNSAELLSEANSSSSPTPRSTYGRCRTPIRRCGSPAVICNCTGRRGATATTSCFRVRPAAPGGLAVFLTACTAYSAEGADPQGFNLGLLRAAFVTNSKKEAEHYADCLRYQQRLAVALKRRQEMIVEDYMVAEVPYEDELPLDRILDNLMVGDPIGAPNSRSRRSRHSVSIT